MIANDFVPLPLFVDEPGRRIGALPAWGARSKTAMRQLWSRASLVFGPVQEIPDPDAWVTLDPDVVDRFGATVARLGGGIHPQTRRTAEYVSEQVVRWVRASVAVTVHPLVLDPAEGPRAGQHQAGTCRMGSDPTNSVTDSWGRVWPTRTSSSTGPCT